jgi:putative membrane protein
MVEMMNGYYGYGTGNMMGGGLGMWLAFCVGVFLFILFVVVIIMGFMMMARRTHRGPGPYGDSRHMHETALDVLNKRYAAGEIDKKEYDKLKQDIS